MGALYWNTWDFQYFPLCGLCTERLWKFQYLPLPVCEPCARNFEIFNKFLSCVGGFCTGTLWDFQYLPPYVWALCWGTLRFSIIFFVCGALYWTTLRFSISSSCVGSVLEDFEIFKITTVCGLCTRRLWDFQNLLSLCVDSILGDFEIFNSFLVCGPCPGRLRFSIFSLCVWELYSPCVWAPWWETLRFYENFPCVPCTERLWVFFKFFPVLGDFANFHEKSLCVGNSLCVGVG